ncbi:amidophosphoribosyltransferase [Salmonella enterica subsp. enterica]|nr:amidophosphoribosyltransferase [Salmonella enterica subsp. enterica]
MCGIVGIAGVMPVNQSIYDALTVLQHRGQDAAGIITIDANNCFRLRKANGLVNDIFEARHMQRLQGNMGIGHVRYPTAGSSSASEAQPFYVNSPYGITLAHNGNLTNAHELRKKLFEEKRRHINTTSDSEILLNIFASELDNFRHYPLEADNIFAAIAATNRQIRGAYACVAMIIGHGMVAFRDPHGIRPLVLASVTLAMVVRSIWSLLKAWRWIRWALNSCAMSRRAKLSILPKRGNCSRASARITRSVTPVCLSTFILLARTPLSTRSPSTALV